MNWLAFNSTSLQLTGHAPFAITSYNVSVTLSPGFIDKTEEVVIPIHFNNTPMTFVTTSFSVYVLGEQSSGSDMREWIPYLVVVLITIIMFGFFSVLVTCCCWQDMCRRSPNPSHLDEDNRGADFSGGKDNRCMRQRGNQRLTNLEAGWLVFGKTSTRPKPSQVIPYSVFKPSSMSLRLANIHVVKQEPFTRVEARTPEVYENVQYANIPAGSSFAYKPKIHYAASRLSKSPLNVRARAEPFSPEWIRFCPETMVVWGLAPEDIEQAMPDGLDVIILSESVGHALAKLRITIPTRIPPIDTSPASNRFVFLYGDGTQSETVNGVDILYIPCGTKYRVKYYPPLPRGPVREGRYGFCPSSRTPPWLTPNPHTLELSGDTTGCESGDFTDLLLLDFYTHREVSRLRITVLVRTEDRQFGASNT
ncbi:hypothetical protein RSOLAG1IB_06545 [Rhizoctonia solani AG-1 IB]|uniref:Uncharacterized protein n=1 Tax=Thanatephorus cucumeris (strain AG1-IB / isolate 7/3/14) TaxID=1108050 RepID=A0A0B7FA22_THACB|nr:hypothetical protein RSOLAG1IB_06545 [Rhizoctonia solani AG-1 IB]